MFDPMWTPVKIPATLLGVSVIVLQKPSNRTEIGDLGSKLAAQLLLTDDSRRIIIPSREEWIGLNLLERDDELERREDPKQTTNHFLRGPQLVASQPTHCHKSDEGDKILN